MSILDLITGALARRNVPIFPLKTVLFPGSLLPLRIFEVRYMDMARECLRAKTPFGVCLIKEGREVGEAAVPEAVGTLARIADCDMEELGILKITAQGTERFRIDAAEVERSGLIVATIERHAPEPEAHEAPGLEESAGFLRKVIPAIGEARFSAPLRFDDATWVGFRLAEILPLRNDVRQKLLELTDPVLRLAVLHKFLQQQKLV